ncbi:MAG: hypothetical protein GY710_13205 [Desulfobacteraceae bacterium]|nr:hypothetical protein [Desulfobacteraceae bacterium]
MIIPDQITKVYMDIYPEAAEQSESMLGVKTSGEVAWPDWCYLPVGAAHAIVENQIAENNIPMMEAAPDIGNLAAVLNWRKTKGVYRFDSDLLASLWEVFLDRDIPVDVLFNLPEWCCYIDLSGFEPADKMNLCGFFVYLEYDINTGGREIRLSFAFSGDKGPGLTTMPFHINGQKTIAEML